jgi:hypothetical protein
VKARKTTLDERAAALKARLEEKAASEETLRGMREKPLSPREAAPLWGRSPRSTRRYFRNVPGVRTVNGRYLIPPSVLGREIRNRTKDDMKLRCPRKACWHRDDTRRKEREVRG